MTDQTQTPDGAPPPEPSLEELKAEARELDVKGRSSMDRDELVAAIAEARVANDPSQQPGTPEQVGRPPLDEVAVQSAIDRAPRKVIGAPDPAYGDLSPAPSADPTPEA